jgi:hypothetical protein
MMAWHYAGNDPHENSLGRHYSRFWPICRIAHKQNQGFVRQEKVKPPKSGRQSAKSG